MSETGSDTSPTTHTSSLTETDTDVQDQGRRNFLKLFLHRSRRPTPEIIPPEQSSLHRNTEKGKIIRRTFLGMLSLLVGGTLLGSGEIERGATDAVLKVFAQETQLHDALQNTAHLLGNEKNNPHFRHIDAILSAGVFAYEHTSGNKAFFQREKAYRDWSFYEEKINEVKRSIGLFAKSPEDLAKSILQSLPDKVQQRYRQTSTYISGYSLAFYTGSGMLTRLNASDIDQTSTEAIALESKKYIIEAKTYIEDQVTKEGKPVSASRLLTFFLQKNSGNLAESLEDTYTFLKFAARNNFESGEFVGHDPAKSKDCIIWMKANITDEYGDTPYDTVSDFNEANNLIGKPYHTWNLLATLAYAPCEVITLAALREQLNYVTSQGVSKIETDLLTLADLKQTERILLTMVSG